MKRFFISTFLILLVFSVSIFILFRLRIISMCPKGTVPTGDGKCNGTGIVPQPITRMDTPAPAAPKKEVNTKTSNWKIYTDAEYKYTLKYPTNWGVGAPCENETRIGFVGIGPEVLKFPMTNCGTANIAPTVYFYIEASDPQPLSNYEVMDKKFISISEKKGQYLSLKKIDQNQAGSNSYLQFSIRLNNNQYLVMQTGAYEWPNLLEDFQSIISTIELK